MATRQAVQPKSASPFVAAVATLILHAALITVAAIGLSNTKKQSTPPEPLNVRIMQAQPPAPATPPVAAPPAPVTPAPVKKRQEAKPRAETKPRPQPQATESTPIRAPEASFDAKPSQSMTSAAPAAPPASAPTPATPAAPAKTSASDAKYASSNRKPPYPRLSQNNNEEGTVVLRVLVKADGTAGAVELKTSSGYPLLDKSALTTVPTWRFTPATVNGKPVDEWYELPVPFKLENN